MINPSKKIGTKCRANGPKFGWNNPLQSGFLQRRKRDSHWSRGKNIGTISVRLTSATVTSGDVAEASEKMRAWVSKYRVTEQMSVFPPRARNGTVHHSWKGSCCISRPIMPPWPRCLRATSEARSVDNRAQSLPVAKQRPAAPCQSFQDGAPLGHG